MSAGDMSCYGSLKSRALEMGLSQIFRQNFNSSKFKMIGISIT